MIMQPQQHLESLPLTDWLTDSVSRRPLSRWVFSCLDGRMKNWIESVVDGGRLPPPPFAAALCPNDWLALTWWGVGILIQCNQFLKRFPAIKTYRSITFFFHLTRYFVAKPPSHEIGEHLSRDAGLKTVYISHFNRLWLGAAAATVLLSVCRWPGLTAEPTNCMRLNDCQRLRIIDLQSSRHRFSAVQTPLTRFSSSWAHSRDRRT